MLTEKQYAEKYPTVCPVCGRPAREIDWDGLEYDGIGAEGEARCPCGATWIDVYMLTGYRNLCVNGEPIE